MIPKRISALVDTLAATGEVKPEQLEVQYQSGFADLSVHNKMVDDLRTDLTSALVLAKQLSDSKQSYTESCRELEAWAEDRYQSLQNQLTTRGYTSLEFIDLPQLPPATNLRLAYVSKTEMPVWGTVVSTRGPWKRIVSTEKSVLGQCAMRYRIDFGKPMPISEITLATAPELFTCYRVYKTKVGATIQADTEFRGVAIIDVIGGPHQGLWYTSETNNGTFNKLPFLENGEAVTIAIPVNSFEIGRGIYEIEDNDGPVWASQIDIVLGSNKTNSWLGAPAPQFAFKTYLPTYKIRTRSTIEPSELVQLSVDEYKPVGSDIQYNLVQKVGLVRREKDHSISGKSESKSSSITYGDTTIDEIQTRIYPGVAFPTIDFFKRKRVTEELELNRFLAATLAWKPVISSKVVADRWNSFDPNSTPYTKPYAIWEHWTSLTTNEMSAGKIDTTYNPDNNYNASLFPTYTYVADRFFNAERIQRQSWGIARVNTHNGYRYPIRENKPVVRLNTNGGLFLKPSKWTSSSTSHRWYMRFVSNGTHETTATNWRDVFETKYAEASIRQSYNESIKVRILPIQGAAGDTEYAEGYLGIGIYRENSGELTVIHEDLIQVEMMVSDSIGPTVVSNSKIPLNPALKQTQYQHLSGNVAERMAGFFEFVLFKNNDRWSLFVSQTDSSGFVSNKLILALAGLDIDEPRGGSLAFRNRLAHQVDIDLIDVVAQQSDPAPIQVTANLKGKEIPQVTTGSKARQFSPEFKSETLKEITPNVYELSMVPVDRLTESDIKIYEIDYSGQVGKLLYEGDIYGNLGQITVHGTRLVTKGLGHTGDIQVDYWGLPEVTGKVPFTYNITKYQYTESQTIKPFNDDIESVDYYPVVEYRHHDKTLYFGQELDKVIVSYDSFATYLNLEATMIRGANPCRSPRINSGHWTLA